MWQPQVTCTREGTQLVCQGSPMEPRNLTGRSQQKLHLGAGHQGPKGKLASPMLSSLFAFVWDPSTIFISRSLSAGTGVPFTLAAGRRPRILSGCHPFRRRRQRPLCVWRHFPPPPALCASDDHTEHFLKNPRDFAASPVDPALRTFKQRLRHPKVPVQLTSTESSTCRRCKTFFP